MNHPHSPGQGKLHPAWYRILPGCCVLVFLATGFSNNVTGLFLQTVSQETGLPYGDLSLSITVQGIVLLLAVLIVPKCLYRGNASAILSAAVLLLAGANLFLSQGTATLDWMIAAVLIAVANAFLSILAVSLILSEWFEQSYGFALGLCTAFSGLSGAILNPFVSAVITQYGWRAAYCVDAGIILAAGLPVTLFLIRLTPKQLGCSPYGELPERSRCTAAPEAAPLTLKGAAKLPRFYLLLAASVAVAAFYMINPHMISITAALGLTSQVGIVATTLQMLTITLFRIVGNLWIDRSGTVKACLTYFSSGALGMLLLLREPATPGLFYLSIFLYSVGASFLVTILPIWVRASFGARSYTQIYPFFYSIFMVCMSGGASLAGMLYQQTGSYQGIFFAVLAAFLLAGGCSLLLSPSLKK